MNRVNDFEDFVTDLNSILSFLLQGFVIRDIELTASLSLNTSSIKGAFINYVTKKWEGFLSRVFKEQLLDKKFSKKYIEESGFESRINI